MDIDKLIEDSNEFEVFLNDLFFEKSKQEKADMLYGDMFSAIEGFKESTDWPFFKHENNL